jgi:hypothetical protein
VEKVNAPRTRHIHTYVNATLIMKIFSISLFSPVTVNVSILKNLVDNGNIMLEELIILTNDV